jgi:hypothetical protein
MAFGLYDASAPVFVRALTNLSALMDKALSQGFDEAKLIEARLAPDMRPFSSQIQLASDSAKGAVARLSGTENPSMADTETGFAELKGRIDATVAFIKSVDASAFDGGEDRDVLLKFPGGEQHFKGGAYLTGFALPNFFFHVTTAYGILRNAGVEIGKRDYLGTA